MQLSPGEVFAIVRQLADPNDTGTYYVRATIRNARTDALLDTKDLTDRGGQRFSTEYQVPSKSSDAIYISISTRVYTDSGYTTLSDVYGQEIETYLVEMRQQHFGGGGSSISYKRIEEIIAAALLAAEKVPEPPIDIRGIVNSAINGATGDLKAHIVQTVESARTVVPAVDFSSITRVIADIGKMIEQVESNIPEKLKNELSLIQKSLDDAKDRIDEANQLVTKNHLELVDEIKKGNTLSTNKRLSAAEKIEAVVREAIDKAMVDEPVAVRWEDAMRNIMKNP
jgi:hypothetical protein